MSPILRVDKLSGFFTLRQLALRGHARSRRLRNFGHHRLNLRALVNLLRGALVIGAATIGLANRLKVSEKSATRKAYLIQLLHSG